MRKYLRPVLIIRVVRKLLKYENTGESKHNDILRNLPLQVEKCGTKAKGVREKEIGLFCSYFQQQFLCCPSKKQKNSFCISVFLEIGVSKTHVFG